VILYHGSNTIISEIALNKCRPFKDFGRGFYLTEIAEQANQMAMRVARLFGGSPIVSCFSFNNSIYEDENLNILSFEKPSKEWALFVINNRDRAFSNLFDPLCNQDNKYDLVYGPVANDDIAYLFRNFQNNLINQTALMRGLTYKNLSNQYSFHTEQALTYLKPLEV